MYPERYARRRPNDTSTQLRDVIHYLVETAMQQASDTTNPKILRATLTKLTHQSLARIRDQHDKGAELETARRPILLPYQKKTARTLSSEFFIRRPRSSRLVSIFPSRSLPLASLPDASLAGHTLGFH